MADDGQHHCAGPPTRRRRKRGQDTQALGRSCGGFSSKIHAVCDALGNPVTFILTAGQVHDVTQAIPLLEDLNTPCVLADKGYDSDKLRAYLASRCIEAVIPPKKNRLNPPPYDKAKYKWREGIERFFNKLKHFKRVATRFDKKARNFLGFLHLAAIWLWIK